MNNFLLNRQTLENELKESVKVNLSEPITTIGQVEQNVLEALNRIANVQTPSPFKAVEGREKKAEEKNEEEAEEESSVVRALTSTFRKGKRSSASRRIRKTESTEERSLPIKSTRNQQEKAGSSWSFY